MALDVERRRRGNRSRQQTRTGRRRLPTHQRKSQILDAAIELFRKRGFLGASVHELAEAVGVSKATLYYHIGSKERVLSEIHERFMEEGLALLAENEAKQGSPTQRLIDFFVAQCWMTRRHQDELAVVLADLDRLSDRSRKAMVKKRDEYIAYLDRIIAAGVATGEFRDLDPRLTALCVMGMANWLHRWYRPSGSLSPEQLGRFMAAIAIGGISQQQSGIEAAWNGVQFSGSTSRS